MSAMVKRPFNCSPAFLLESGTPPPRSRIVPIATRWTVARLVEPCRPVCAQLRPRLVTHRPPHRSCVRAHEPVGAVHRRLGRGHRHVRLAHRHVEQVHRHVGLVHRHVGRVHRHVERTCGRAGHMHASFAASRALRPGAGRFATKAERYPGSSPAGGATRIPARRGGNVGARPVDGNGHTRVH